MNNNSIRPPLPTIPPMGSGAPQPPAEIPLRDRIARTKTLVRRGFGYWKLALLIFVVGAGLSIFVASRVRRVYRSECTVLAKPGIRTTGDGNDSPEAQAAKMGAKLKDALTTRSHLEAAIKKFGLYPATVESRGMKDAADEMLPHVGFRALDSGRFVISFDSSEVDNRSTQDLVRDTTQYLAESLIDWYSSGDLDLKKQQLAFDESQAKITDQKLEQSTKELAMFLLAHPEFAMDAKQAASQSPLGIAPNPAMGIPIMPGNKPGGATQPQAPRLDPALAQLYQNDGQLQALWRERARLQAQLQSTPAPTGSAPAAPTSTAQAAALTEQITQAQADLEAAAKNAADAQADLSQKSQTLGPDNPDLKAAQNNANAAAVRLHQAKVRLATLQAQQAALTNPTPSQPAVDPNAGQNAEVLSKMKDIDGQISAREGELKRQYNAGTAATAPAAPTGSATAPPAATTVPMNPVVQLETEYLRLFRELTAAKSAFERAKLNYEKSQTAVDAAQQAANDLMTVVEPAYRPTAPYKGGRTPWAAGGLFLAMLIAGLYAAARVVFNDTVIDAEDIEALQLIPVLGTVPKLNLQAPNKDSSGSSAAAAANRGATGAA